MGGWEVADVDEAASVYRSIADPTAEKVLDLLIDHPEQRFDGAAICRELGLSRHAEVARATFHIGCLAAAQHRPRPWNEAQLGYAMADAQAELFRRARGTGK